MIKIEALTLELAYSKAATSLACSITELHIEVVQVPSNGFLGFFKKSAIIVAVAKTSDKEETPVAKEKVPEVKEKKKEVSKPKETPAPKQKKEVKKEAKKVVEPKEEKTSHNMLNDTIMPASFVSDQDDEDDDLASGLDYTADYDDEFDETEHEEEEEVVSTDMLSIAKEVEVEINKLFKLTCFNVETIEVTVYDKDTLLVEFKGDDAALLIGKEGYRYKALSYMIFNWINSKYEVQLRLEIAEFLKNQEESMNRYLSNVCENIDRDGRAQTKILDGILVQIALKELRERYPNKYVAIRSTRDGLKFVIVNEYNNY